jgi:hypothetical protein
MPATTWPRDEAGLRQRFEDRKFCPEEFPSGEQAALLLALLGSYAHRGLAPSSRPLCVYCPLAKPCWHEASAARRIPSPEAPENGGIILPWVGANYRPGGLLVLAVNPNIAVNDETHLLTEHAISWDYDNSLGALQSTAGGSTFGYRMACSASLLLAHAHGRWHSDEITPQVLVRALHSTARLQTVKCVPARDRSRPTTIMQRRCPEFLLEHELAILRPGMILTLGSVPDAAVAELRGYTYLEDQSSEFLWRHQIHASWGRPEVFGIPHPADPRGGWQRGHDALRAALDPR